MFALLTEFFSDRPVACAVQTRPSGEVKTESPIATNSESPHVIVANLNLNPVDLTAHVLP
jgi:hypothetical protein